jgi:hypothetical protein
MRRLALQLIAFTLVALPALASRPTAAGTPHTILLPLAVNGAAGCPDLSINTYASGPAFQFDQDDPVRPAWNHADKNLGLRGYTATTETPALVDYGSGDPTQPPQLATLFSPARVPPFSGLYRANSWNWASSPDPGAPGGPITDWPVTVLGLQTTPGEGLFAPAHGYDLGPDFGHGALVIFADPDTITLKFTRDDSAAPGTGYTLHVDGICTDPNLLALYATLDNAARNTYSAARPYSYDLPGLTAGQVFGTARGSEIRVAVVDSGAFMDPRSCNEWWQIRPSASC